MGTLTMSVTERQRLEIMGRVSRGEVTLAKAAELLGLSYRQVRRVRKRYEALGDGGLVHGLRGRPSNRRVDAKGVERAMALYGEHYSDFGPTLAAEYLAKEHGLVVTAETLRRWMIRAGRWEVRGRRQQHRQWRARKEHRGEMVQMDGSDHLWFEDRGPRAVMMVMIDDATNWTTARFFTGETTEAAFTIVRDYLRCHGRPHSLYVDRDSIYQTSRDATVDEKLAEEPPLTQFGRAMQDLGVRIILARSPQAKGRVERRHGVFQDRLVKALRRQGINDLPAANAYLEQIFLPELNDRFTVAPAKEADLHRPVDPNADLDAILSFQESRSVRKDWTIAWRNRCFQLTQANQSLALAGTRILVSEHLDGSIHLLHRGQTLVWNELDTRPAPPPPPTPPALPNPAPKPKAEHPWRRRAFRERR